MVGWLVGAGINLVGSIAINLGTNVMKLGHNKRAMLDMPEDEKPPVTRFREWQVGTAVFIVGNVANFVSFGYAAQSLLAALGSVQFVSNVFFASFVLKEKITMLVITATGCIIGGCMLLVLFGNHSSDDYTVEQLLALYRKPAYIVYLVMMFVFVLGSYILYLHGKHVASIKGREQSAWVAILPVTYSIFSALLGTQSVLFSKSLSVLLRTTFSGQSQLGNWYTWVTLVCFLITAGFWVTRLNKGLRLFPAMIIVPLMQICWTLFSIISGMLYFQEYTAFNPSTAKHGPLNAIMFTLGVLTVFVGVFLLTKSGQRRGDEIEEAQEAKASSLELTHNPAYEDQVDKPLSPLADPDLPQKDKLSMDTLRFTSLASNTAANIKTLNKAGRKSLLSSTMSPGRPSPGDATPDYPSTPDAATAADLGATNRTLHSTITSVRRLEPIADMGEASSSLSSTVNMMGTLRKGAKKFGHQLRKDFNVDLEDFRRMFGMGQGAYMPALSLFAMPAVDLTASSRKSKQPGEGTGRHAAMLSALPQSRFYGLAEEQSELQKTRSEDLDRTLLLGPSSSAAEHGMMPFVVTSGGSLPGSFTRQMSAPRPASVSPTHASGLGAGDPSLLRGIVSKTMKQVEDAASRARWQVEAGINKIKDQRANAYQSLDDEDGAQQHPPDLATQGSGPSRLQHTHSSPIAGASPRAGASPASTPVQTEWVIEVSSGGSALHGADESTEAGQGNVGSA